MADNKSIDIIHKWADGFAYVDPNAEIEEPCSLTQQQIQQLFHIVRKAKTSPITPALQLSIPR